METTTWFRHPSMIVVNATPGRVSYIQAPSTTSHKDLEIALRMRIARVIRWLVGLHGLWGCPQTVQVRFWSLGSGLGAFRFRGFWVLGCSAGQLHRATSSYGEELRMCQLGTGWLLFPPVI